MEALPKEQAQVDFGAGAPVLRPEDQQVSAQPSLVNAVAATYRLSQVRYDKGIDSYLSVLDAQRSLYAAQQGLVSLHLAKLANQVTLYAALGGGSDSPLAATGPQPRPVQRAER